MITIIYSTHKDDTYNNNFKKHLLDNVGVKDVQILEFKNQNEYSLAEVYNKGIEQSEFNIVCCIHNDIKLEKGWGKKLLKDYQDNPEYGIIGKAGSCYFPESGVYWERMGQTMVGQVYHHPEGQKKWLNKYSPKLPFLVPVVTIDGLFISFDKTKIKHRFNETIGKFHFYDHPFSLSNYLDGIKIGVTSSFEITHQSIGKPNQEFYDSKVKFLEKFSEHLPLDLKPDNIFVPEVVEKPIKNVGKVAVVIPTKNNFDLLQNCVDSFFEHCNPSLFDVFIADTGSENDEKVKIKTLTEKYPNVHIIEYDYYNFAKINNDVINNHVSEKFSHILFCNNDVKLLNNVIYGMLKIFKTNGKVGTVGCRLHFEDNTIQHDSIMLFMSKKSLQITHKNLFSYYSYSPNIREVVGSTAALLMISKTVFKQCGGFNEDYIECFEDVELNLKTIQLGYKNYYDGDLVAYHYESKTRNLSGDDKNKRTIIDYNERLSPFIVKNINKFKHHIVGFNNNIQ